MDSTEIAAWRDLIQELANEVYSHLGAGFDEAIYQSALAYEMRKRQVSFQREINIEIVYKGVALGLDRPDFVIRPCKLGEIVLSTPIVLELKTVDSLSENHRNQVKAYLVSMKHSADPQLQSCKVGFLINFPKKEGKTPVLEVVPAASD
ncbi:MAG: GxxExxY protein [Pseudanabaenaceae cyanobacterium SKYGB_i_bin29]|nr:GxxExxY protein [Pseudanabaenaceae cyanobacterium SKYG29]MDW8420431.1 GxxExxY protein [Pseudanabaenaceae cyanobacterium SKYGB_i_bin29]